MTVTIVRPTIDIAPLSNKQVETYLTEPPAADAAPEVWMDRSWSLLAMSVNNARVISGFQPNVTIDELKAKIGTNDMTELCKAVFEISGLVLNKEAAAIAPAGESPAALNTGGDTSVN